jgi:hypothetical protein
VRVRKGKGGREGGRRTLTDETALYVDHTSRHPTKSRKGGREGGKCRVRQVLMLFHFISDFISIKCVLCVCVFFFMSVYDYIGMME